MRERYIGLIASVVSMLLMYLLGFVKAYQEVRSNWLVFFLLLIVFATIGGLFGNFFESRRGGYRESS